MVEVVEPSAWTKHLDEGSGALPTGGMRTSHVVSEPSAEATKVPAPAEQQPGTAPDVAPVATGAAKQLAALRDAEHARASP